MSLKGMFGLATLIATLIITILSWTPLGRNYTQLINYTSIIGIIIFCIVGMHYTVRFWQASMDEFFIAIRKKE